MLGNKQGAVTQLLNRRNKTFMHFPKGFLKPLLGSFKMNFIRSLHEDCLARELNIDSVLRRKLRMMSQSLVFVSTKYPQVKTLSFDHVMSQAKLARVVLFGEHHHTPPILKAQLCVLERMVTQAEQDAGKGGQTTPSVILVMEMFNFEQQSLLDAYVADDLSLEELDNRYQGTEGFAIQGHYGYLLQAAKEMGVKPVAGFASKQLCTAIIKEGKQATLEKIEQLGGPTSEFYIDGSEDHYNYFQGLISGNVDKIVDKYRRIFPAQVLRDSFFARTVMDLTDTYDKSRILGICGSGHLDFKFGIPERISTEVPVYVVTSRGVDDALEHDVADSIFQYAFE